MILNAGECILIWFQLVALAGQGLIPKSMQWHWPCCVLFGWRPRKEHPGRSVINYIRSSVRSSELSWSEQYSSGSLQVSYFLTSTLAWFSWWPSWWPVETDRKPLNHRGSESRRLKERGATMWEREVICDCRRYCFDSQYVESTAVDVPEKSHNGVSLLFILSYHLSSVYFVSLIF